MNVKPVSSVMVMPSQGCPELGPSPHSRVTIITSSPMLVVSNCERIQNALHPLLLPFVPTPSSSIEGEAWTCARFVMAGTSIINNTSKTGRAILKKNTLSTPEPYGYHDKNAMYTSDHKPNTTPPSRSRKWPSPTSPSFVVFAVSSSCTGRLHLRSRGLTEAH